MSEIKHATHSEKAQELEKDPDYVTKGIIIENGVKTAIFEKVVKDEEPKPKEKGK